MLKNDRFTEKTAKGFKHLLKVYKKCWSSAGSLISCLGLGAKAVASLFLILENCDETNAKNIIRLIGADRDGNLKFFLEKCDSELAKKIFMLLLKNKQDNIGSRLKSFSVHPYYKSLDIFIDMVKNQDFGEFCAKNFMQLCENEHLFCIGPHQAAKLLENFDEKSSNRFVSLLNSEKLNANKLDEKIQNYEFDSEFFAKELCIEKTSM